MRKIAVLVFFSCIITSALLGQQNDFTIRGRVVDANSKEPLPYALVFIPNTTLGAVTDTLGRFEIFSIPLSEVRLGCSFVGYETWESAISLNAPVLTLSIELKEREQLLNDVQVTGKKDKEWNRQLDRFKRVFLGNTPNASKCDILNPWVLDFKEYDGDIFMATADEPIEIENKGLGYLVHFFMKQFVFSKNQYLIKGQARFQPLKSEEAKEKQGWERARTSAYRGSEQHFFKSIWDGTFEEDGFHVYAIDLKEVQKNLNFYAIPPHSIKKLTKQDILLDSNSVRFEMDESFNSIEVHYPDDVATLRLYKDLPYSVSRIENLNTRVALDEFGNPRLKAGQLVFGEWSKNTTGDLLPLDYRPDKGVDFDIELYRESIALVTDKPTYQAGETINYSAYLMCDDVHFRDSLSRILYVDLISTSHSIIQSAVLPLVDGKTWGSFLLKEGLPYGTYYVRLYTNLMRNFGNENCNIFPILVTDSQHAIMLPNDQAEEVSLETNLVNCKLETVQKNDSIYFDLKLSYKNGSPAIASMSMRMVGADEDLNEFTSSSINCNSSSLSSVSKKNDFQFQPEQSLSLSGQITNSKGKPVRSEWFLTQPTLQILEPFTTDDEGRFFIPNMLFTDSLDFYIKETGKKKGEYKIKINPHPTAELPRFYPAIKAQFLEKNSNEILTTRKYDTTGLGEARILEGVEIVAKKISTEDVTFRRKNAVTYGQPDYIIRGETLTKTRTSHDILESLVGLVPGLYIKRSVDNSMMIPQYEIYIRGGLKPTGSQVLILLNGVPVSVDQIYTLNVIDVERVEVITRANPLLSSRGGAGAIAIYTKTVSTAAVQSNSQKDFSTFTAAGFTISNQLKPNEPGYWIPDVRTDWSGKVTFSIPQGNLSFYQVLFAGVTEGGQFFSFSRQIGVQP